MTNRELIRRFPNASPAFIQANCPDDPPSSAEPKRPVRDDSLGKASGAKENSSRLRVRIISRRRRLIDPDNLVPKWFIDCLRYAGYIPDDRAQDIILEVSQEKVKSKAEECTRIEILPAQEYPKTRDGLIAQLWDRIGHSWNREAFDVMCETLSDADLAENIAQSQCHA